MFSNLDDPTWERCSVCRAWFDSWCPESVRGVKAECPYCKQRPIPVSERLPEVGVRVLWYSRGEWEAGTLGYCENGGRPNFDFDKGDPYYDQDYDGYGMVLIKQSGVTHWLAMPPKPEMDRPLVSRHDPKNPNCLGNQPMDASKAGFYCNCEPKPE